MPDLLRLAASAARHHAQRQAVLSANVANADTPGYRARDLTAFREVVGDMPMRQTRIGHLGGGAGAARIVDPGTPGDPNGNTVSLEDQVLRGIEAQRAHDRALTVYRSALDMIRASLGNR
ncbi:MAG: FlgB family protein [Pseudomonadota bacterium]